MSRYIQMFTTPYPPQQVNECFMSYLTSEGFEPKFVDGENVWKKGVGLLTAPQYIKLSCQNNVYVLEAWLKFAILPGVYVSEMDLDGFVGCIPKSILKSRVDCLLMRLQAHFIQPVQQQMLYANPNVPPQVQGNPYANPNVPPQVQGNPYANPNVPPQVQGNPYANPNVPQQVQGNPYGNPNIQNTK